MIVAGPSNSGKTFWVYRLLANVQGMFDVPVASILYCYSVFQPLYTAMKETINDVVPITFQMGLPKPKDFEAMDDDRFHIIVLDDMMDRIVKSKDMMELFSIYCHHKNFTAIFITQNIFMQGIHSRSISLNAHVFVLFANRRDEQQLHRVGRQFYPTHWREFVDAYKDATDKPYSYLVIDVTPAHPRILQLRTNIFPPDYPTIYSIC